VTDAGGVGSTEPQGSGATGLAGAGAGTAERPSSILVVANETLTGGNLIETLRRRAEAGPVRVHVVAPVSPPRRGYVVYRDSRRAAAERRLQRSLRALQGAGVSAEGEVVDDEPLAAVRDALAMTPVDEIVVSTHPESRSGWLRRNLVEEIRRVAGARPVEHVISDVTGEEGVNVLVVANETVLGEELFDRIRVRAKEGRASFLVVCPQSDPRARPHPEAESRLWAVVFALRSEGIDVHGQVAHPDPYTAAMQAVHDERIDEIIVSTYPGTRSGWLRRDLVGRLRAEAGVPVEHVIVESIQERVPAA
jgi:phosphopantetheine adenylyltransferase